ncbi:Uncharacterised protein [Mycobacteroides abscessus subsp. abscessus]|nr:Uncharacterised protein [Mycobacteroides abscessus subsp. abscessus]SKT98035.1 Uncharacterised protein [Mycobacteroides abscessus subsp. abscessus]
MCSGCRDSRVLCLRRRSGTCRGTYSPIIVGRSTVNVSSISSSSMLFMSMTQWNPLTGPAYGLAPSAARTQVSDQPRRLPLYFSGMTASP